MKKFLAVMLSMVMVFALATTAMAADSAALTGLSIVGNGDKTEYVKSGTIPTEITTEGDTKVTVTPKVASGYTATVTATAPIKND
ncbi:MAG: hypothetical protein RR051_07415, partial [Clostridiales bacterium]